MLEHVVHLCRPEAWSKKVKMRIKFCLDENAQYSIHWTGILILLIEG